MAVQHSVINVVPYYMALYIKDLSVKVSLFIVVLYCNNFIPCYNKVVPCCNSVVPYYMVLYIMDLSLKVSQLNLGPY